MKTTLLGRWRTNFVTGLALILPGVITLALLKWLFGTVSSLTNVLLFFVPRHITHARDGAGEMYGHWSLVALVLAAFLISLVGLLARYYVGKKMIAAVDSLMLRVPLLNKVYGTLKQVNEAFNSDRNTSFQTVVLVEFPRVGLYSVGFITSEQNAEVQIRTKERIVSVFVPTTPNPTTGFLVMVPEDRVTKLDMTVAEGIRYIISLGSVSPEYTVPTPQQLARMPESGAPTPPDNPTVPIS